jgi:hypothetical protein
VTADQLVEIVRGLSAERPVFHAEADFQHGLAWAIARARPNAKIRLERPYSLGDDTLHVDDMVQEAAERWALELKHWTRKFKVAVNDEEFHLLENGAYDTAAYDFWKDVHRVERLVEHGVVNRGFVVALSNAPRAWAPAEPRRRQRRRVPAHGWARRVRDAGVGPGG